MGLFLWFPEVVGWENFHGSSFQRRLYVGVVDHETHVLLGFCRHGGNDGFVGGQGLFVVGRDDRDKDVGDHDGQVALYVVELFSCVFQCLLKHGGVGLGGLLLGLLELLLMGRSHVFQLLLVFLLQLGDL